MPDGNLRYANNELDFLTDNEPTATAVDNVFASDDEVQLDVRMAFMAQAKTLLESVSEHRKDWHPDNEQIHSLVDPFMFLLVYEHTLLTRRPRPWTRNEADRVADAWASEQQRAFPRQTPCEVVNMIVNQVDAVMTRDEAMTHARFVMYGHGKYNDLLEEWAYGRVTFLAGRRSMELQLMHSDLNHAFFEM
ncbi:hypothetical protein GGF31_006823 [Allomyces arbusculus]|nr:hypothetical protein GGF31_006823 [Allomyces arbusculus]